MRNVGSLINSLTLTRKNGCHSRWSQDLGPTPCVPFIWRCLSLPSSQWFWLPGFHHRSYILILDPTVLMEFTYSFLGPILCGVVSSEYLCSPRTSECDFYWKEGFCTCNEVKMKLDWIRMGPNLMTGIRREKSGRTQWELHVTREAKTEYVSTSKASVRNEHIWVPGQWQYCHLCFQV